MGEDKALLDAGGQPFVVRVIEVLREGGGEPVLVVVRRADGAAAQVARGAGAEVVVNATPDEGPISSLRAALGVLPSTTTGVLLHPVDHPRVEPSTVAALIHAFAATRAPVTVPVFEGRSGHPVLLASALFPELLEPDLPEGARTVVRRHAHARQTVEVDDVGVLDDIDTPEAYRRAYPRTKGAT
jgi:CTP:molybdopterin cytidylyltransferase MocA